MESFWQQLQSVELSFWLLFAPLVLAVWFLPVILAFFFNRAHLKYIAIAAVPAGLSFIAWGALLVWACSGQVTGRYAKWFANKQSRNNADASTEQ